MRKSYLRLAPLVAIAACGTAFVLVAAPRSAARSSFTFPDDGEVVLTLTSTGTQLPVTTSVGLYASGTAVIQSTFFPRAVEIFLSVEEREALLQEIADGGLAYYDAQVVAEEQKRLSGTRIVGNSADTDLAAFSVQLRVLKEAEVGTAPVLLSRTVVIYGAARLAERFPTIRAYRALARLEERFNEFIVRATAAQ
ncbi:MAG: hypothetical protein QG573_1525 [Acidobacteriota bacterium]|nr:hypothetical protein [Acidobacteriota bacterium]